MSLFLLLGGIIVILCLIRNAEIRVIAILILGGACMLVSHFEEVKKEQLHLKALNQNWDKPTLKM